MPSNNQHSMTKSDSSRVQSSQAKSGGNMSSSGFAARAQSAGDRNMNSGMGGKTSSGSGYGAGGNGSNNSGNSGSGKKF